MLRVALAALVLAVAGVVVAVALGEQQTQYTAGYKDRLPQSRDEKAATASAAAYVQAVLQRRAERACAHAAGDTFRRLRCAHRAHVPRELRLQPYGGPRVINVRLRGGHAGVWFVGVVPGPVQAVELHRLGRTWRVRVGHEPHREGRAATASRSSTDNTRGSVPSSSATA